MGYNSSTFTTNENDGSIELCVEIHSGEDLRPFNVTVQTKNLTAGAVYEQLISTEEYVYYNICVIYKDPFILYSFLKNAFFHCKDGQDYVEVMDHVLSFNTSITKLCHNISILDDDNCECKEYFVSSLSTSDYNIKIDVPTVTICISADQNDRECRKLLCVISNF